MTQKKDIIQGNQEEKFIKQSLTKPLYITYVYVNIRKWIDNVMLERV